MSIRIDKKDHLLICRLCSCAISIYLMVIFGILSSLIMTCIWQAENSAVRLRAECSLNMGLYSVFAEYNRELFNQYGLLYIDTSYGTKNASYHYTQTHLLDYINYNTDLKKDLILPGVHDLFQVKPDYVEITQIELASDRAGASVKEEAIDYMKNLYGLDFLESIQEYVQVVSDENLLGDDMEKNRNEAEKTINTAKEEGIQVAEDKWIEASIENPADEINANRTKGILNLVVKDTEQLSTMAVDLDGYCSKRTLSQGTTSEAESLSPVERLIFDEYCIQKMGCYTNTLEKGLLKYQLEYLIAGHNSDIENLREVCNTIILMREAANFLYLISDSIKVAEADALALAITSALLAPYLQPAVKYTLLAAWAYAESIMDMRSLLSGEKIPIIKTSQSFRLSLEGMLEYEAHLNDDHTKESEGLDYEMYLRILLAFEKEDMMSLRVLDIMEMDVRLTEENTYFRMDACVGAISATLYVTSRSGYSCYAEQSYSYYKM